MKNKILILIVLLALITTLDVVAYTGMEDDDDSPGTGDTTSTSININSMQKESEGDNYQKIISEIARQYTYRNKYQKYNSFNTFVLHSYSNGGSTLYPSIVGYEPSSRTWITGRQFVKSLYSPEEVNSQHMVVSDCSAFMYVLYNEAFCYGIYEDFQWMGTSKSVEGYIASNPNYNYWYNTPFENWSNEWSSDNALVFYYKVQEEDKNEDTQMKKIKYIMDNLQIGDIVASIKYKNGSRNENAHMMMYVGDGKYIDYGMLVDYYRSNTITDRYNKQYSLDYTRLPAPVFLKSASDWWTKKGFRVDADTFTDTYKDHYLFWNVTNMSTSGTNYTGELAVLRPLNEIRNNSSYASCYQKSLNRLNYPELEATKLSSLYENNDVSKCDEVTYTVELFNHSNNTYTVPVKNTISSNAKLVSGSLDANITIKPNEKKTMSYTVMLNNNAEAGDYLVTEGTVGGVKLNTLKNRISGKLSDAQIKEMKDLVTNNNFDSSIEMISAVYKKIYNYNKFDGKTVDDFINSVFDVYEVSDANYLVYNQKSEFSNDDLGKMAMKNLYGGYFVFTKEGEPYKPADFREEFLQPGDILTYISYSGTYDSRENMNKNITTDLCSKDLYLYLGNSTFVTIQDGRKVTIDSSVDFNKDGIGKDFILGLRGDVAYTVHRPSVLFDDNSSCSLESKATEIGTAPETPAGEKKVKVPDTAKTSILVVVGLVLSTIGTLIYVKFKRQIKNRI